MGAEEVKMLTALMELLLKVGDGSLIPTILAVVIGPWVLCVILVWTVEKNQSRRHRAVQKMYENNVELVKTVEKLAERNEKTAESHRDLILMNTQAMTRLTEAIKQNQFCPMQRVETRQEIRETPK